MATCRNGHPNHSFDFENKSPVTKVAGFFSARTWYNLRLTNRSHVGAFMVSPNVNKMLQQAQSLSLAEREQFIELLRTQPAHEQLKLPEDELAFALAKKGIRLTVPPKRTAEEIARFRAWKPITMPGGSLSDELIRDRR